MTDRARDELIAELARIEYHRRSLGELADALLAAGWKSPAQVRAAQAKALLQAFQAGYATGHVHGRTGRDFNDSAEGTVYAPAPTADTAHAERMQSIRDRYGVQIVQGDHAAWQPHAAPTAEPEQLCRCGAPRSDHYWPDCDSAVQEGKRFSADRSGRIVCEGYAAPTAEEPSPDMLRPSPGTGWQHNGGSPL